MEVNLSETLTFLLLPLSALFSIFLLLLSLLLLLLLPCGFWAIYVVFVGGIFLLWRRWTPAFSSMSLNIARLSTEF